MKKVTIRATFQILIDWNEELMGKPDAEIERENLIMDPQLYLDHPGCSLAAFSLETNE